MKKSNKVLFIALASLLAISMALLLYFSVTVRGLVEKQAGRTVQHYGVTTLV